MSRWRQRHNRRDGLQLLQLGERKQPVLDEHLARGRRLVGIGVVVVCDYRVDVRCVDAPTEASYTRAGKKVLHCSVPGEVGAKDFARPQVSVRNHQRSRERAPEMSNDAQLESSR